MGQYFEWVNLTRYQILDSEVWDGGFNLIPNLVGAQKYTDAALTLIAGDWKDDLVIFYGDYSRFKNETDSARKRVEEAIYACPVYFPYDLEDVTGRFEYVKTLPYKMHYVWVEDAEDSIEVEYDGPFDMKIEHFRYVINESKREYVDRARTPVVCVDRDCDGLVRYDPIPELLCTNIDGIDPDSDRIAGLWMGDKLTPSHEPPSDGYTQVYQDYTYWGKSVLNGTDEEIYSVIEEAGLDLRSKTLIEDLEAYLEQ